MFRLVKLSNVGRRHRLIAIQCAMTVNSRVIATFLGWSEGATDVPLNDGLRVQILPSMAALPRARKHQYAAFLNLEKILVVWDDDAMHLVSRAKDIESQMMDLVWATGEPDESDEAPKKGPNVTEVEVDEESGEILPQHRPTHLLNTVLVGITLILIVTVLGAGFRALAIEIAVDHQMIRLAFLALTPVQVFFTLVSDPAACAQTMSRLILHATSSSPKSLLVVSLSAWVPYDKCK